MTNLYPSLKEFKNINNNNVIIINKKKQKTTRFSCFYKLFIEIGNILL